ncbi:G-box binding factor [Heterostelium album PN500]|uniref:G-box binding factor n=1 Tax=Heterostelium pallidum (strain ATCC 26659 / Pp 5 / PN500) TaxID=670386 RepID=D3B4R7_HETP5|nr:G-box binding factor [Heterostelium album PN500]EFA84315.1 G-box binding factor [Heterostelium album PN500]|eukprot:XP_020436430.1 G-box binding factor [Heterostelium album PN500]
MKIFLNNKFTYYSTTTEVRKKDRESWFIDSFELIKTKVATSSPKRNKLKEQHYLFVIAMLPVSSNTNSATTSSSATSPQSIHTDVNLTLPLPSIFHNNTNSMNPPILFSPSASLTPSFMLPSSQSSMLSHNSNIFQDASQPYGMDMPNMVEQFNMHSHAGHSAHYSPAIQYPYLYLQQSAAQQQQVQHQHPSHAHLGQANVQQHQSSPAAATTTTPTKSVKRKHNTTEKKETTAPNTIPKCTRCSESASWRHDKRRWWCKECKKAFTPGISKLQNASPTPQTQMPMAQHQQWDQPQPNSSQNTPPSVPQNPNQVTPVSCNCPSCGGTAGWKHDKKRWFCKDCKKAFTLQPDGSMPTSPTSPKPKKTKQKKNAAATMPVSQPPTSSTVNNQLLQANTHLAQPQQLPPFNNTMFLPPLGTNKELVGMPFTQMRVGPVNSPTSNTPPSIPSPSSIMNMPSQVSMNNNLLVNGSMINPNLSPTGSSKKMAKKKEKDMTGNDGLQVLVSVDNGLPDLSSRSIGDLNGVSDYSKMTQNKYPVQDLRYIAS